MPDDSLIDRQALTNLRIQNRPFERAEIPFDEACYKLAGFFLPYGSTELERNCLAEELQETVEAFLARKAELDRETD